jgi:hypothetical protein
MRAAQRKAIEQRRGQIAALRLKSQQLTEQRQARQVLKDRQARQATTAAAMAAGSAASVVSPSVQARLERLNMRVLDRNKFAANDAQQQTEVRAVASGGGGRAAFTPDGSNRSPATVSSADRSVGQTGGNASGRGGASSGGGGHGAAGSGGTTPPGGPRLSPIFNDAARYKLRSVFSSSAGNQGQPAAPSGDRRVSASGNALKDDAPPLKRDWDRAVTPHPSNPSTPPNDGGSRRSGDDKPSRDLKPRGPSGPRYN